MTDDRRWEKPRLLLDQRTPMRDGVELSTDVYLPTTGDGPWPVILMRTPYDNTREAGVERAVRFTRHDYVVAIQDVRGRGDSDGTYEPFVDQANDGHDTLVWTGDQWWCNGSVGMMGVSYGGLVQWAAAREQPPYLKALVSTSAAGRWGEELPYRFGIFSPFWIYWLNAVGGRTMQMRFGKDIGVPDWHKVLFHRPLRDQDTVLGRTNTVWRTWLEHNTVDAYWKQLSLTGHFHKIDIPALHITGWFDGNDFNGDQMGQLYYWHNMIESSPAADRQWLLAGPWDHAGTWAPKQVFGERDFGPAAVPDMDAVHLRFFDRWLKEIDNGQERDRRVRIFTMGRDEWRDEDEWPPAGTTVRELYLHSGGAANTIAGDGTLSWDAPTGDEPGDTYVYNPDHPVWSTPDLDKFPSPDYPLDNRWRLRRDDVLVYTSALLEDEVEITGHPHVRLYASSDCPDTDWHVTLCDVLPDGRSEELLWGCLRAAYRHGSDVPPTAIEPGKVEEYTLEMPATSNLFQRGHRIRLTITSSHFPMAAINPNTNAPTGDDDEVRIATNTVHHSRIHASCLLAPVAPSANRHS
jgi:uncharacterized protein